MTNYNERLDEILSNIDSIGYSWLEGRDEAKQAILSDLLEIIDSCFENNDGFIDEKLRERVKKYCD